MEKIRFYDGTVFEIQAGSTEYLVNIIAISIDETVAMFKDSNLERYEILTETDNVCAIYTKKHLKNFKAEVIDSGYLITLVLVDRDELYERVAELELLVATLTQSTFAKDETTKDYTETETEYVVEENEKTTETETEEVETTE